MSCFRFCTVQPEGSENLNYMIVQKARTLDFFTETAIDKPLLNVAYA